MKNELDQIMTFGPGVKAFRVVVNTTDAATDNTGTQIVRTENAKRLGDQLRATLLHAAVTGH